MNARTGSVLAFAGAVVGVAFLALRQALFATHPLGIAVQVLAFALMVWARITFGRRSFHAAADPTTGGLVTHGPYRYWRHPIYAAILYFVWAGVPSHLSLEAVAAAGLVTLGLVTRMLLEERLLRREYPGYEVYARQTSRVVPFVV
ncbi:MAG TPA: methyltransferase [Thermoanaerobaculia bacterium]|nr:methyltransferase [Thermoanaerobaculia bacterium]